MVSKVIPEMQAWCYKSSEKVVKVGSDAGHEGKSIIRFKSVFTKYPRYFFCSGILPFVQVFRKVIINDAGSCIEHMCSRQIQITCEYSTSIKTIFSGIIWS